MLICNGLMSKVLVYFDNGIYRCRKSKADIIEWIIAYVEKWDSKAFLYDGCKPIPYEARLVVVSDVKSITKDTAMLLLERAASTAVIVISDCPLWFCDKDKVCEASIEGSVLSFEFAGTHSNRNEHNL